MAKGGYRKPANPAPVSGPGKLSRRTDGKQPIMETTGGKYGEAKQLREIQQSAPMAQVETSSTPSASPLGGTSSITPLFAPTSSPSEPITAGMPFGAGSNTLPSGKPINAPSMYDTLRQALELNRDPDLEIAFNYLMSRGEI